MPHRPNVLVVDDAHIVRTVVAAILRAGQYEVHECAHAREALMLLDLLQMDAIVTDLDMPLMDGVALIGALKARPTPHPPVLIVATSDERARFEPLLERGRVEWLAKPFDPEDLRQAVARLLA